MAALQSGHDAVSCLSLLAKLAAAVAIAAIATVVAATVVAATAVAATVAARAVLTAHGAAAEVC
jgi:hypothetical protein